MAYYAVLTTVFMISNHSGYRMAAEYAHSVLLKKVFDNKQDAGTGY